MTPPDFSVLLLAWDAADPSVAVLGGAALPPTLPLVYELAARQPVVAVFPHLPAGPGADAPHPGGKARGGKAPKSAPSARAAVDDPLTATGDQPGVRVLAGELPGPANGPVSHLIGLAELQPAAPPALGRASEPAGRSQWPAGATPGTLRAPAAPYVGASTPPPAPARPSAEPRADAAPPKPGNRLRPAGLPQAGDLRFDPDPDLPRVSRPSSFDEPSEETGPAEAAALAAGGAAEPLPPAAPPTENAGPPAAGAGPVLRRPAPAGLNFRLIQYARQAAQLVRGRRDFGVIYAPNWPAWLAALEIRNSTGQPLVLYAAGLATEFSVAGERGWLLEIERMALRRASVILVPDEDVCHRLRAQYGATIGEVRVVAATDDDAVRRVLGEVARG